MGKNNFRLPEKLKQRGQQVAHPTLAKNFDFYRAKNGDIYIQGNQSPNRIKIDIERYR